MENQEFWTKANRVAKVTRTSIRDLCDGDFGRPRASDLVHPSESELKQAILNRAPIWRLTVFHRTGFDEEESFDKLHTTREAAEAAQSLYQVNMEIDPLDFMRPKSQDFDPRELSFETVISVGGRGEPPYFLVYKALNGAGIMDGKNRTSEHVLSWVGRSGRDELKTQFGENWEAVAELEYCVKHFHPTSLATLAARVLVADFVADRDYDAGYASRELEMLMGGAEQTAIQAAEVRKKAGEGGGKASIARKLECLEVVMQEIELLSETVGLISETRILATAFENASKRHAGMPKSSKTWFEYETTLRSEEPFKSRYEAVFKKTLKRFPVF